MDIELIYKIQGQQQTTPYSGITVTPNFDSGRVVLTFPQITGDYDDLYNDMESSPTELEVKLTAFDIDIDIQDLIVTSTQYSKIVSEAFSTLCTITITLEHQAP